ncbi:DDE-type integrase/transposase/recombinase [Flavobacteriaceae bacterium W22]|nr:DDE-type integrase/transposase/recombinase [Flavobacteriaceae bacterium W22]
MQKYKKYHTDIKTCYALGIQNEVLPQRFIKEIPGSTSHYWKNEHSEKYVGSEFSKSIQNNLEDTKVFLDSRLYFSRKAFIQFARIYITLITLLGKENIRKVIKANRNVFVTLIENLSEDFPIAKKDILRFLMISKRQYSFWLSDRKFACNTSLVGHCFKRRPKQISNREISILKKYMNLSKHKTWCIRSIWGKAIRDGVISMAESTWYKYARKLGYSEVRKPKKKPRKKGSYNAKRPNETWHMDISQYKTLDNITFYIYTVVDNFSRKILSWDISTKKCSKIRMETVKQAIKNEFDVDLKDQNLELIVDGGSENNNKTITEFIKNCHVNISKKIALKDVTFSNSIVEGPYKIMKSYYFRSKEILSTTIYPELKFFIEDYNNNRPCYKHKIYTPNEVHNNPELANFKLVLENSNQQRLEENRNFCCKISE